MNEIKNGQTVGVDSEFNACMFRESCREAVHTVAALQAKIAEMEADLQRHKSAVKEWLDKTEWVQKTVKALRTETTAMLNAMVNSLNLRAKP